MAKELDNNATLRKISDFLDENVFETGYGDGYKVSKVRQTLHAAKHYGQYLWDGNPRERERAKDQWNRAFGGSIYNLYNWDKEHNYHRKT